MILADEGKIEWRIRQLTDLHTTTKAENQVKGGLLLDIVVRESAAILKLLASEDQTLLIRGNSLLVLDLALDIVDGVRGLDLKGDGLASDCKKMLAEFVNENEVELVGSGVIARLPQLLR